MTTDDLIAYKNFVFGEYEQAKNDNNLRKMKSLAFQVADLEESIAEELIKEGNPDRAAVNLVSQGSMLFEIGRIPEGKAAWEKAKTITTKDSIKNWVDEGLKKYA
jgi:hypothetical protein